jgi:HEAT repeat protein
VVWSGFAQAQADSPSNSLAASPTQAAMAADFTVEQLFRDFIHYAKMGQFRAADSSAKTLLIHPDLNPAEVAEIADQNRESIQTIQLLIKESSSIGESASRVMELIERGRFMLRHDRERLQRYIADLGGTPQQELLAIKGLKDGGEYSVPLLIAALQDPTKKELWPRIIQALSRLEKDAVGPLVRALAIQDNAIRQFIINALGEIGYAQSIPYLRQTAIDPTSNPETKEAANRAVARIEQLAGRTYPGSPDELFVRLSEGYYDEDETLRADPRLDTANVWYWDAKSQALMPVVVPTKIFGPVMAMRSAEEALLHRNENDKGQALWLAANVRRESRLGMNIESGDPNEKGEVDATRPPNFPRALYFTMASGPRFAHQVLGRAVKDADSAVALGAIEALRLTAGEASLVGSEDTKQALTQSLKFPDLVVRIRAALALGAALPRDHFADSELVVPVLASTLSQTGRDQFIVVDRDGDNGNRIAGLLRNNGFEAIVNTSFLAGLGRARSDFQRLSGAMISTDIAEPNLAEALARLRAEFIFAKIPVIVLAKPEQELLARDLATRDAYVEVVDGAADEAALNSALERVRTRTRQSALNSETAMSMALQSSDTLRRIVENGRTAYDVRPAAPALIGVLSSSDERLQKSAASVLALINAPAAQRAIAHLALSSGNSIPLRVAAFSSLSESARTHGDMLEESQVNELVALAKNESDLIIRTAASQALGALNLAGKAPSDIIRSFHGG